MVDKVLEIILYREICRYFFRMIIYAGRKNIWLKTAKELILRKYKNGRLN
jgi:hypothetical protein